MTCETCRYYFPDKTQCRVRAPKPFIGPSAIGRGVSSLGVWPPVQKDDWCGEHAPKVEEKP